MTERLLSVDSLHTGYDGVAVVRDLTMHVDAGEVVALLGPNGAGKTTLIAQLSGQLKSDRGSIHFNGRNILGLSPAQRARAGLARSFQITSVFLPMT
ncbi:MAG: ATP-binding cassette domain-containing protein, partial [Acidimicrobiia bacterium]|nr:ATP-binding cassette domain-containing protein [Acidimicrobiia bacterium]